MALNDVYQVKVEQTLMGQEVLNVFFYEERLVYVDTNPTHAQTVAEEFVATVIPAMRAITQAELFYDRVVVQNLFDPADGYTYLLGLAGTGSLSNDVLPTFDAIGFELVGETTATKRGAKRVAGLSEAYVIDGVISDAGFLPTLAACGDAFVAPLMIGAIIPDPVYRPCIVKRVRTGTPGNYLYRLPTSIGESITNILVNALIDLVVTSQVSRKIGIGS